MSKRSNPVSSWAWGVAAISEVSARNELASGELVALDWQGEDMTIGLYMVWNSRRWQSPALTAFLDQSRIISKEAGSEAAP